MSAPPRNTHQATNVAGALAGAAVMPQATVIERRTLPAFPPGGNVATSASAGRGPVAPDAADTGSGASFTPGEPHGDASSSK